MKKNIEHLPLKKRKALQHAVSVIREMCDDIEMIILYGSHARGDYRDEEDLKPDRKSGAVSDYDILVLTENVETAKNGSLWYRIEKLCNGQSPYMPFRIIAHDIAYLKKRLKEIHYFFNDIVREGCILYESGKYELYPSKELPIKLKYEIALEHYDQWYNIACNFFLDFENAFLRNDYRNASFHLHQSAESAYKALLLVFTNYVPHDHYLRNANEQVKELFPDMEEIFPCPTKVDEDCFENFDYAYIGARYNKDFCISLEDLKYFSERVKFLMEITEKLCTEKIESYKQ